MEPGHHKVRTIGIDYSALEDRMVAAFATMARDGTVVIEHIFEFPRRPRIMGMWDMYAWPTMPTPRNKRNRHHKAKAQPNRGPRGNNPW